jgi:hypothetical protein
MKTTIAAIIGLLLGLACLLATGAPARWHKWRSKLGGETVCSQVPLGPGWDRMAGAYKDSRCEIPTIAK